MCTIGHHWEHEVWGTCTMGSFTVGHRWKHYDRASLEERTTIGETEAGHPKDREQKCTIGWKISIGNVGISETPKLSPWNSKRGKTATGNDGSPETSKLYP